MRRQKKRKKNRFIKRGFLYWFDNSVSIDTGFNIRAWHLSSARFCSQRSIIQKNQLLSFGNEKSRFVAEWTRFWELGEIPYRASLLHNCLWHKFDRSLFSQVTRDFDKTVSKQKILSIQCEFVSLWWNIEFIFSSAIFFTFFFPFYTVFQW